MGLRGPMYEHLPNHWHEGLHQSRAVLPDKTRVFLGWFPSLEAAQEARRKFNDDHCPDRSRCLHPEHIEESGRSRK